MRPLLLAGALLLVVFALLFGWSALTTAPGSGHERVPSSVPSPAAFTPPKAEPQAPRVTRDLLRYEEPRPVATARAAVAPARAMPSADPPAAPAPPEQRLVGFVHRRGALCGVLALPGNATVVALAAGESSAGHTLVAIDEEQGARLRLPDGSELLLTLPN